MAYSENNNLTNSVKGKLGNSVVFKQYNGKTIYCKTPRPPRKESPDQKMNRDQFREASAWAVQTLLNPVDKESFRLEAIRLKLKDPYTAALKFKLREFKAQVKAGFAWVPILTLKEATEAAIRKRKRFAEQASASQAQSVTAAGTIGVNEAIELRKSVDDMNHTLQENLLAMQKSIQESLLEMNKAIIAIGELVKSSMEIQRPAPQREQLKQSIHTSLRPAIASMESVRRSYADIPETISGSMDLPDNTLHAALSNTLHTAILSANTLETDVLNPKDTFLKPKPDTPHTPCSASG